MDTRRGIILEVVSKTKFHTSNWLKMLTHNLKFEFSCVIKLLCPYNGLPISSSG